MKKPHAKRSFQVKLLGIVGIAASLAAIVLSSGCKKDEDCSLNGLCSRWTKNCACDLGWRGSDCGELDIRPAKREAGYNRTSEGISSWGSKVVRDPDDQSLYHAFVAEFDNHCGLDYWSPYSRIIRAESRTGPAGPYQLAEEVVPHSAHNPTVVFSPADQRYLLYYIGCPQEVNDTCTAPSFTCGPGNYINGESGILVMSSPDLMRWSPHGRVLEGMDNSDWDAVVTNPSPWPLCSAQDSRGDHDSDIPHCPPDILLVYRGCNYNCSGEELITLAKADRFDGTYDRLNNKKPLFPNLAEDPFVWQDARENFHILVHSLEPEGGFGDGPKVGRHAFSRSIDGPWHFNEKTLAFSTLVKYDDGSEIDFFRRERPQLFFSGDGKMTPLFMTTGVQEKNGPMSYSVIVPIGDHTS